MNDTEAEITSQPEVWLRSLALSDQAQQELIAPGERMLVLGCGTSWFVAQALAELRESAGFGETDAVCASEFRPRRHYDRVVAVTRSGTSTEVLEALRMLPASARTVAITAVRGEPVDDLTDAQLVLDFADERSVVQTRFPTTVLALARHAFGEDLTQAVADARQALRDEMPADPADIDHLVFLGTGWTYGLANEAALKVREAAQAYSESYPAKDFRHGPVAVCGPRSLVWSFGDTDPELDELSKTAGATAYRDKKDPLAQLVLAQRFALALAAHRGLDPDHPRLLTRSVVLTP
ncbi:SIS domain-containing protein [Actinoplanes sp. NPDC051513]|uniref:SIS domain-containing protein n=1 Tax=Actinoplanes sp. NPDC051513 TaxID=3363908 RepID=UPI0037B8B990